MQQLLLSESEGMYFSFCSNAPTISAAIRTGVHWIRITGAASKHHICATVSPCQAISAVSVSAIGAETARTVTVNVHETGVAVAVSADIALETSSALLHDYGRLVSIGIAAEVLVSGAVLVAVDAVQLSAAVLAIAAHIARAGAVAFNYQKAHHHHQKKRAQQ